MLPINEIFQTIQGEAKWTGTPALFIRLQGCPVGCGWCDTKHTWTQHPAHEVAAPAMLNKTQDSEKFAKLTAEQVGKIVSVYPAKHVVFTGGEPAIYDLREVSNLILSMGRTVQLETSGTHEIKIDPCAFVTVSPKVNMPGGFVVRQDALLRADEIKHPVGKQADIDNLLTLLSDKGVSDDTPVWLQPLSQSPKATELCIEAATRYGWRLSIQTHKFIGVR